MPLNSPNWVAGEDILPGRFVTPDITADYTVKMADDGTAKIVGISQYVSCEAPLPSLSTVYAAKSGYPVPVHGQADTMSDLVLGGAVTRGDFLTATANGAGVTASAGEYYGAVAQESGVSGDRIRVLLLFGQLNA